MTELERRRRERFKIGVYAALGTAAFFLAGMLIQGCQNRQEAASVEPKTETTEQATNQSLPQPTNPTDPALATASRPESNSASPAPASEAPLPPEPTPSASAASAPALTNTPPAAPVTAESAVYVVKHGDSLFKIARAHGTSVKALKGANGLKGDTIVAGRKLKIPRAKTAASTIQG